MSRFSAYAAYYDLLYRDKDYDAEAAFVGRLVRSAAPGAQSVLEFGSGTGLHALALARDGFQVTGVDLSPEMVDQGRRRAQAADIAPGQAPDFQAGDVRTVRLDRRFDAVVSLFHVMSYQTGDADLGAAVDTAAAHLPVGGAFVFDFWYGPAVLAVGPTVRVKRIEDEAVKVFRVAEPRLQPDLNRVDVDYTVVVTDKLTDERVVIEERHPMRYLFLPEIEALLDGRGFEIRSASKWMSPEPLDDTAWSGVVVATLQSRMDGAGRWDA